MLKKIKNRLTDLETAVSVLVNSPTFQPGEGGGFNGLAGRKRIFEEVLKKYRFSCIIETGTHNGETTGYLSVRSKLPVYSSEINKNMYLLARMRLKNISGIYLYHSDSRAFIKELSNNPEIVQSEVFFYLDAHWGNDCPLVEEIEQIASRWEKFVIIVDDFQVPGDDGYGYDRYSAFRKMNISLIRSTMKKHELCAFFPTIPSAEESVQPKPRGFVLLTRDHEYADSLETISLLRRHKVK
ncbi:MAG: hypothetical protein A2Z40_05605 [Deltaproteobacteria bacterium RBG_19FT_COMBO_60_16]|nr:MAG: hypothetical protein A2Z13_00270 [Deltaproteobacteria bacterium RBG_16_64_85]OGQ00054.1 MAG: hypothetical protein A2Z40_05605 [Deltaproteobacteria bacterium RBG_19FT_COMBO_60_16]